ncbi:MULTISPECIES: iron uptake porin [unclassified Okeania]|uniref:iron uptake porin n=1 Tax=unclassified Okeania TaxID=2634635 RepID=UPI0013B7B539|nr:MULTISPECIES: iron uptake porin [unclassified Okeania]NES74961.1 iron uptake porin [Okeania sp. SIO1H4]NET18248.1 iron uptake porin [Okeania sp. SIO1H5]NET92041.1 iron uptake porin [Okeania sp. SIO1H2]
MTRLIWKTLKHSPSVFSAALLMAGSAIAAEAPPQTLGSGENSVNQNLAQSTIENASSFEIAQIDIRSMPMDDPSLAPVAVSDLEDGDSLDQVTSVTQLSDVQPTDWAFQALQSLVERYGCIAGYPDGTYKGNRAMTRFEFAAGLNSCLDRITELIAAATSDLVTREDLAVLQRLQEEFAAELAALRGRVDALEARTAELENNQFSTTTKLNGEVLFWLSDTWGERAGGRGVSQSDNDKTQTTFGYRVRLNFDTSFTGEDRLRTRLQANNIPNYSGGDLTNSLMTRLATDSSPDDTISIDKLAYRFPVLNGKGEVEIAANGYGLDDFIGTITPLESSGAGAVSRFGRFNPIYYRAPSDAGVKFAYSFSDAIQVTVGYAAPDPEDPREGRGAFNGGFSGFGQFTIEPNDKIAFQLGYVRTYHPKDDVNLTGSTGSFLARDPFEGTPTTADTVNFEAQWRVTDGFQIGGWGGASFARPEDDDDTDDITIITGALTLAFPDLLKEGSLGGIIVGVPPIVTDGGDNDDLKDDDTSIHIEAFYRFQMNDNIAITPGVFVITNPNHIEDNDTLWVGTLRTQFRF